MISKIESDKIERICKKVETYFQERREFVKEALDYFISIWEEPEKIETRFLDYLPHMPKESLKTFEKMMDKNEFDTLMKRAIGRKKLEKIPYIESKELQFRYSTNSLQEDSIKKILQNKKVVERFSDKVTFFDEAVGIFITLWEEPEDMEVKSYRLIDYVPKKALDVWETNNPESFKKFMSNKKNWETQNPESQASYAYLEQDMKSDNKFIRLGASNVLPFWDDLHVPPEKFQTPKNALEKRNYALINQFTSRFLPLKIAVCVLAKMQRENKMEPVNYNDFSKEVYNYEKDLSLKLKKAEKENEIKRWQKISTGLPTPPDDLADEKSQKVISSKKRFLQHFIGIKESTWRHRLKEDKIPRSKKKNEFPLFDGALISFNLAYFVPEYRDRPIEHADDENFEKCELKIGLTEKGRKFYLMKNQIMDDYDHNWYRSNWPDPLSNDEKEFIKNEIIPNFELESYLIDDILKMIKTKKSECNAQDIEKRFEKSVLTWLSERSKNKDRKSFDDIQKILTRSPNVPFDNDEKKIMATWRTSLMGRLSELNLVEWMIATKETENIERGLSYYTIPKQ